MISKIFYRSTISINYFNNMSNINVLGSFYPTLETYQTEFKEFWLKYNPSLMMENKEIHSIIKNGIFTDNFQKCIDKNIKTYIKNYVPKYLSCFVNSNINGKLIIGIKDDGEYTGIPSIHKITKQQILNKIMSLTNKYIKTQLPKDKFMNIFDITIDKLDIPDYYKQFQDDEDPLNEIIELTSNYRKKHKINVDNFEFDKIKWFSEMDTYRGLLIILNNKETREEFIKYIENRNKKEKLISIENEKKIICEIRKNKIQQLPEYEPLQKLKVNKKSLYFWLVKFKDWRVLQLCNKKPDRRNYVDKQQIKYIETYKDPLLIIQLPIFRHRFIKKNPNLNYYTITIHINGENVNDEILFRKSKKNSWNCRYRIVSPSGPGCSVY